MDDRNASREDRKVTGRGRSSWEERLKVATSKPESLIEGEAQILSGAGEAKPRPVEARDVQPTIKIRLGWPVRMLVNKELVLRPWIG